MCIIVSKNKNASLPSKKILKNCFDYNSDGAGFMYVNDKHRVVIDKGYMTFDSFYKRYQTLKKEYDDFKNKSLVMHFRIGTSSGNTPENTHPYPVTNKLTDLHKTYFECKLGVVHNGIIHDYDDYTDESMNDTQRFIKNYVYKLYKYYPTFYKDKDIMLGVDKVCGGKLCFLDTDDNLYYVGEFIEDKGIMYSNSSYEDCIYDYHNSKNYTPIRYNTDNYYDDCEEYYTKKTLAKTKFLEIGDRVILSNGDLFEIDYANTYSLENDILYEWYGVDYDLYTKSMIDYNCFMYDEY